MITPGTHVEVFDNSLYKNDLLTPSSVTLKEAVVVCRYGKVSTLGWRYPDLVDVQFLHDGRISKGHFTDMVREL